MSFLTATFRLVMLLSLTLGSAVACKSKEDRNARCEGKCASKLADQLADCESEIVSCLSQCDGPDDFDCTWDCDEFEYACLIDFSNCYSSCPCAKEATNCFLKCDLQDQNCFIDCGTRYTDCGGTDTPSICVNMCLATESLCKSQCDSLPYDSSEFRACRRECTSDAESCIRTCE
jgi:hypothetical protein